MRYLLVILIVCLFNSCFETDCKALKKIMSDEECNIVLNAPPEHWRGLLLKGYCPINQNLLEYENHNRWWILYYSEMDVGDTIVKKRGELTIRIQKKDTVIMHKWNCY